MRTIKTKEIQQAIGPTTDYLEQLVSVSQHVSQGVEISTLHKIMDALYLPADAIVEASESLAKNYQDPLFDQDIKQELEYIRTCKCEMQLMRNNSENSVEMMEFIISSARGLFNTNINLLLAQDRATVRSLENLLRQATHFAAEFEKISNQEDRKRVISKYMTLFPNIFTKIAERCESLFDENVVSSIREKLNQVKLALKASINSSENFILAKSSDEKQTHKIEMVSQLMSLMTNIHKIILLLNHDDENSERTPVTDVLGNILYSCQFFLEPASKWLESKNPSMEQIGYGSAIYLFDCMTDFVNHSPQKHAVVAKCKLEMMKNLLKQIKGDTNNFTVISPEAAKLAEELSSNMKESIDLFTLIRDKASKEESNGALIAPCTSLANLVAIVTSDVELLCANPEKYDSVIEEIVKLSENISELTTCTMASFEIDEKCKSFCVLLEEAKKLAAANTPESKKEMKANFAQIKEQMLNLGSCLKMTTNYAIIESLCKLSSDLGMISFSSKLTDGEMAEEIIREIVPSLGCDATALVSIGELQSRVAPNTNFLLGYLHDIRETVTICEPTIKALTVPLLQRKVLTEQSKTTLNSKIASIDSLVSSYLAKEDLKTGSFEDKLYSDELLVTCLKMQLKEALEEDDLTEAIGLCFKFDKMVPVLVQNIQDLLEMSQDLPDKNILLQKVELARDLHKSMQPEFVSMLHSSKRIPAIRTVLSIVDEIAEHFCSISVKYEMGKMNNQHGEHWFDKEFESFKAAMEKRNIEDLEGIIATITHKLEDISTAVLQEDSNSSCMRAITTRSNFALKVLQSSMKNIKQPNTNWLMLSEITRTMKMACELIQDAKKQGLMPDSLDTADDSQSKIEAKLNETICKLIPPEFEHIKENILHPADDDRILMAASTLHKKVAEAEISIKSHGEESMNHARIVALLFADLSQKFANLESLSGVIDISKKITKHSCAMLTDLKKAYDSCKDRRIKDKCKSCMDKIEALSTQLKILCAVKASTRKATVSDSNVEDTDDALIKCSENLMMSVQEAVSALASARLKSTCR